MKKNYLLYSSLIFIVFLSVFIFKIDSNKRITVNGIGNFDPVTSNGENYLLFYPADSRVSQENSIVKEVTKAGDTVREYEIQDNDFRRMLVHQKPNNLNKLYISLFGEATIDNYFYTYEINEGKFKKVSLDYFKYEVGVDHIIHYGDETLFQTLVSHKTGEQNMNLDTNEFNVSISNYSSKKSFETEYGHAPKWAPLLEFNNRIIYGTSGQVNQKNEYENAGIGIIDIEKQTVEYNLPAEATDLIPIYSTKDHAYIIGDSGELFVYDKNLQYKIYHPFKKYSKEDMNYYNEESPPLLIDMNRALVSLHSETTGSIVGVLTFEPEPKFQPLKKNYFKPDSHYRFLYQDVDSKEIYLIRINEKEESVLVIDNQGFNLLTELPVKNSHLLDFIVKI